MASSNEIEYPQKTHTKVKQEDKTATTHIGLSAFVTITIHTLTVPDV
jgi:hypothetical protein